MFRWRVRLLEGRFPVEFEAHRGLVVLVQDHDAVITLGGYEQLSPLYVCDDAVAAHKFRLGRAALVEFLLLQRVDDGSATKGHAAPGVDLHIGVDGKGRIYVPVYQPDGHHVGPHIPQRERYHPRWGGSGINPNWILLDSQSTCDVFSNPRLLRYIQRVPHHITIHSQAGQSRTNLVGYRPDHRWVWYQSGGIGNIYSMKLMTKRHRVTFDSEGEGASANAFVVHKPSGPVRFGTSDFGLYFNVADVAPSGTTLAGTRQTGPDHRDVVWQTVDAAEGMTHGDVTRAGQARRLQQTIAFPSGADFEGMVRGRTLRDCDITTRDITNVKAIFGPALDAVRGKTTRRFPMPARAHYYVSVPRLIRERNRDLDINADLFFINGLAFLVTRSRRLRFITAEVLADQFTHIMAAAMT